MSNLLSASAASPLYNTNLCLASIAAQDVHKAVRRIPCGTFSTALAGNLHIALEHTLYTLEDSGIDHRRLHMIWTYGVIGLDFGARAGFRVFNSI